MVCYTALLTTNQSAWHYRFGHHLWWLDCSTLKAIFFSRKKNWAKIFTVIECCSCCPCPNDFFFCVYFLYSSRTQSQQTRRPRYCTFWHKCVRWSFQMSSNLLMTLGMWREPAEVRVIIISYMNTLYILSAKTLKDSMRCASLCEWAVCCTIKTLAVINKHFTTCFHSSNFSCTISSVE